MCDPQLTGMTRARDRLIEPLAYAVDDDGPELAAGADAREFDVDRIGVGMAKSAVAAVSPQVRTPEHDNVIDKPNLAQRRDLAASSLGATRNRTVSGGDVLCILPEAIAGPKIGFDLALFLRTGTSVVPAI
ncbi:hypothetical protein NKI50_05110 [Mesorhizobium sp. M0563]|uniref:hypothetical protein n=1 Tax=unclassified Mesorhizobium TaxID=325217 RepID=UPI00333DA5DC